MRNVAGRFKKIEALIAALPSGEHWGAGVRRTAGAYFVGACAELGLSTPVNPEQLTALEWEAMATRHQRTLTTSNQPLSAAGAP